MSLLDGTQRDQATNPDESFIVQAPAGSGKTEILTQRYLRLLSKVTAPEQIIALTFTRKAASEMRERIILALQHATINKKANSPHQQKTLDFAHDALKRSERYQWDLLQQPNRLKVITIDSLCQSINQAIPLLEKQIAYPQITDKPQSHYLNAARNCIHYATITSEYQNAIKTLLIHVDNRQDRLLDLFIALLAQRDQWLASLFQARAQEKATFEQALRLIEHHELSRFKKSLPLHLATELTQLIRELACIENNPESARYALKDWCDFQKVNQDIARVVRHTLLTGENSLRKSFDHHVGLIKKDCPEPDYRRLKEASQELFVQLNDHPDFINALLQISQLPKPEYDKEQWEVLQALFIILPLLAGHLQLLFAEHNEVDFAAISQQALVALGEADNPTDLALYLDNTIHHLLVDEFQDTSISQFELLSKLVHGWQPDDGKTLFVVGDPMQSIYRFRQAEVGLFFRAKEEGIGGVSLKSLELCCNFRSTETIVHWVNQQFKHIFPQQVDIESGAVSFHPSVNVIQNSEHSAIHATKFNNKEQEANYLIEKIQHELSANSEQTLAILVRSRSHLIEIINLLRQHQIPYQGTDIDLLANLMHLRDVWSVAEALLTPGNRLSWLAALRSPYCGLSLKDLLIIAQFNKSKSIYATLLQLDKIQGLSEEARTRAHFFIQVMHQALSQRHQIRISDWVMETLKKLHVERILSPAQLIDLTQLWTLLDRYEQEGRLPDMKVFLSELNKLYSQQATPSRLHIMTIHKSKGLEFDTVFLPGLGAPPNRGDSPMLRWLKIPTQHHGNLLLVSPIQAAHQEHCALYDYLSALDAEKSSYEAQRLLYVAATRAKSRLYLTNGSAKNVKNSFYSLLKQQEFVEQESLASSEEALFPLPKLTKLPLDFYHHNPFDFTFLNTQSLELSTGLPRLLGIVTHQLLQWICDHHPQSINEVPWNLALHEFRKLGFDQAMQEQALFNLQKQISHLFQDKTGLWIIAPHANEHNEYELLVEVNNHLVTRIIDRSFEDEGKLWIIDFKTGKEDFTSHLQYEKQLNEYSSYLSSRTSLPIHCGLYYLSNSHWVTWEYLLVREAI